MKGDEPLQLKIKTIAVIKVRVPGPQTVFSFVVVKGVNIQLFVFHELV